MKRLASLLVILLPGCALFGLSEEEQKMLNQHLAGAGKYFDDKNYEKAIDQTIRGLKIDPDNYKLQGIQAWAHLELSYREEPQNEANLKAAERIFSDLIALRDIEDHDPRFVFGYAIALYNWGRVEESRAQQLRRDAKQVEPADRLAKIAKAEEHERVAASKDATAKVYFRNVAEGNFDTPANRRESYLRLMALAYRQKDYAKALEFGAKNLELNAKHVKHWNEQYQRTEYADREVVLRRELAALGEEEIKVRRRLAAYHQERAKTFTDAKRRELDIRAAIVHLDAVIKLRPNSGEDYYLRGDCYRSVAQHAKAREDFTMFRRLNSLSPEHKAVRDVENYLSAKGK